PAEDDAGDAAHQGHPAQQQESGERQILGPEAGRRRLHRQTLPRRDAARGGGEAFLMAPDSAAATLADAVSAVDAQLDPVAGALAPAAPVVEAARAARFVQFTIDETSYAVAEAFVTELDRVPRITLVPQTPPWLGG